MFEIELTPDATDDLATFRKYDQQRLLTQVEEQFAHEPFVETRQRKRLRPNRLAEWELRVGEFRVFYDVVVDDDSKTVRVVAIGVKQGNRLFVHGEQFEL